MAGASMLKTLFKRAADPVIRAAGDAMYRRYDRVGHEGFPQSTQLDGYSCGAQSVKMALDYFLGGEAGETWLKRRLGTDEESGTATGDMVRVLRASGLTARSRIGGRGTAAAIRRAIDQGKVLIGLVPTWRPRPDEGHWVCIYGYTTRPRKLLMMRDPAVLRPFLRPGQRVSEYIVVGQGTRASGARKTGARKK